MYIILTVFPIITIVRWTRCTILIMYRIRYFNQHCPFLSITYYIVKSGGVYALSVGNPLPAYSTSVQLQPLYSGAFWSTTSLTNSHNIRIYTGLWTWTVSNSRGRKTFEWRRKGVIMSTDCDIWRENLAAAVKCHPCAPARPHYSKRVNPNGQQERAIVSEQSGPLFALTE